MFTIHKGPDLNLNLNSHLCLNPYDLTSWTLESTLPFKIPFRNFWETTQLSKMLCDYASLAVKQFEHNIVSTKYSAVLYLFNVLEGPSLVGEYLIFLANSIAASREPLIIFIALTASPSANWRAWPQQHVEWTQSRLCTLLLQS